MAKLSIIVPVFNEAKTVEDMIGRIARVQLQPGIEREMVVVDDHSTDGTSEILKRLAKQYSLVLLRHDRNYGKGKAIRTGLMASTGDFAAIQDADLEYDPNELPKLLAPLTAGKADLVFGSRYLGKRPSKMFSTNYFANRILTAVSNFFTGYHLTDMETCHKAFTRNALNKILPNLKSERFDIEPEITAAAAACGFSIIEVPISYEPRTARQGKKIKWHDGFPAVWAIVKFGVPVVHMKMSRLYRVLFRVLFVVYILFWFWTVWFSGVQIDQNIKPVLPVSHVADSAEYAQLSGSLRAGQGFSTLAGTPEYFRTPGYPLFMAVIQKVTGGSLFAVTFIQILLVFATAMIVRLLGQLVFTRRVGEIASIAFLLNPFMWVITLTILSDVPFIFLFILGIYVLVKNFPTHCYRAAIWSALIFSVSIYIRPMGVFALPVFLAPLIASKAPGKKKLISSAIVIAIIIITMLPWMVRNKNTSGIFEFSSLKSYNLAGYNIPIFLSLQNGTKIADESNRVASTTGVAYGLWRDAAYSPKLDAYTNSIIKSHPFAYAKFQIVSALPFFFVSPVTSFIESWYDTVLRAPAPAPKAAIFHLTQGDIAGFFRVLLSNGWYTFSKLLIGLIILLAIYGVWINRKKPDSPKSCKAMTWAFAFIVVYMALLAGPVSNIRYRMPVDPLILLLAIDGILMLYSRFKPHEKNIH